MTPFWAQGQHLEVLTRAEQPVSFRWEQRDHQISKINVHWRVHTTWWSEKEIFRDYWEVTTDTGLLCVCYRDLAQGEWYLERVYE